MRRAALTLVATAALLSAAGCADETADGTDRDRAASGNAATTSTAAGQSPEDVAQRFLQAFADKDPDGLCDVVLQAGEPVDAAGREACVSQFELDFQPPAEHSHDSGHDHSDESADEHDEHAGEHGDETPAEDGPGTQAHFDTQLKALARAAEEGPSDVGDEVDGSIEVTYPLDDAPLVVTLQKYEGSWYVAGTR